MSRKAFGNKENKNKENCRDDKETKLLKKAKGSSIPQNMCFQWLQVSSDEHENLKHPDRGAKWTLEDKLKEHQTYGVNINSKVCVLYIQIINIYYKKYAQSLQRHQITPEKRQALLLWMGRTLSVTKMCSYQTYFLVMSYFDNFLELSERPFCNSQVHTIGLVCIGLASKITDINALQFDQIELMGRIANQLYKELQVQFIQTLENNLIIPTYFEQFDLIGRILYFKYMDKAAKFTVIYYKGLRLLLFVTQYYEVTHYPLASVAYYCHEVTLKGLEKEYDVSDMLEELQFIRFKYQITQPVDMMIEINTLITKGLSDEQEKQLHAIYFAY